MTVRAAIVGLGSWGQTLVTSAQSHVEDLKFTSGYTRTPSKVGAFCAQHGIELAASYEAVLADAKVDAVVLTTPHSQHEEQIKGEARREAHLLRKAGRPSSPRRGSGDRGRR